MGSKQTKARTNQLAKQPCYGVPQMAVVPLAAPVLAPVPAPITPPYDFSGFHFLAQQNQAAMLRNQNALAVQQHNARVSQDHQRILAAQQKALAQRSAALQKDAKRQAARQAKEKRRNVGHESYFSYPYYGQVPLCAVGQGSCARL